MCAQIDQSGSHEQRQRPLHLNMTTPLNSRTLEAIQCEITKDMITTIAMHAKNVIPCTPAPALTSSDRPSGVDLSAPHRTARSNSAERLPSPPTTPGAGALSTVPPLDMFITNLVLRSRVQAGTLICTLVYLQRLRRRLPKEARGMECTCHRIFLATLIVAGKYLNDASPKNKYWARYSTVFTVAEVNLMEKQLLFLLDFDLRIDNEDLNEAASSFYANNSKHSVPLTPTTPPFGASHSQAIGNTESAATAAASSSTPSRCKADSGNMPDSMHAIPSEIYPQYQQPQKSNYYHGNPETAKIYPSTLGLGNKSEQSLRSRQHTASCNNSSSMAAINDRENNAKGYHTSTLAQNIEHSCSSTTYDYGHPLSLSRRQFSFDPKNVPFATEHKPYSGPAHSSASELIHNQQPAQQSNPHAQPGLTHRSSAGPLYQISADEQLHLRPSPKKRAVSRGHHGNVPHPSPVYHQCPSSGMASLAATAAPSASTSGSAYFLQPLEQAQSNYARSRYQQQRYDPNASRCNSASNIVPRMAISIPSLRKVTRSSSPELVTTSSSALPNQNAQKGRYTLRHQSTVPDISKLGEVLSGPSAIPFSVLKAAQYLREQSVPNNNFRQHQHRPVSLALETPELPMIPLPARLASSGSDVVDASPVNTLVYEQSPATAAAQCTSDGYHQRSVSRVPSSSHMSTTSKDINERTLTTAPVSALSTLSFGQQSCTKPYAHKCSSNMCTCSANSTMLCNHGYTHLQQRTADSQYSHDTISGGTTKEKASGSDIHVRNFAEGNGGHSDSTTSNSGGWQLKTKFLHPLSNWFRSSRNQQQQQQEFSHSQQTSSTCASQLLNTNTTGYCKSHIPADTGSKGTAKVGFGSSLTGKRLRDRGMVSSCSMSPIFLEPPMTSSIAAPNNE